MVASMNYDDLVLELRSVGRGCEFEGYDGEAQTIYEAADAIQALQKDALRYRWLKANHLQTGTDSWIRTGDDLEEAIDEAMQHEA